MIICKLIKTSTTEIVIDRTSMDLISLLRTLTLKTTEDSLINLLNLLLQ